MTTDEITWQGTRTMYLVKRLEMLLRSRMEPLVRSAGLTVPQYTALSILQSRPGLSSADLARNTFVSAQSMNELVNTLHGRGLIVRTPNAEHAKILSLSLSETGAELIQSCALAIQALEDEMLAEFESDSARAFQDSIRSCIAALVAPGSSEPLQLR